MEVVSTFYKFFPFAAYVSEKAPLFSFMNHYGILGNVILADEGINATVSGSREAIDEMYEYFKKTEIGEIEAKENTSVEPAFRRLKIKLKKELISIGKVANPRAGVGEYLNPEAWNELIKNPETILLDTRNVYEVELGTFKGAINPKTQNFHELPEFIEKNFGDKKDAPIATFCTGGIRCEKLTAYMREQGYNNVYHLKGGIIQYLNETPEENLWQGECFVFDDRVAIG